MDAIESGIVKIPRVPVDDDVADAEYASYLHLWEHVSDELPKRRTSKVDSDPSWVPPVVLEGALRSLYDSYARRFQSWEEDLEAFGEPPPVLIVVCPNTQVDRKSTRLNSSH